MVAVVHEGAGDGQDRVERPALDALRLHAAHEAAVDEGHAAHVIVEQAHLHARAGALGKDLLDLEEAGGAFDGVVLHEDEPLRLLQLRLQRIEGRAGVGVELHLGVAVGGELAPGLQIAHLRRRARVLHLQRVQHVRVLLEIQNQAAVDALVPLAHGVGGPGLSHQQVQNQAQHREGEHQQDPQVLGGRAAPLVDDDHRHDQRQQLRGELHVGERRSGAVEQRDDPADLQNQRQRGEKRPADAVLHVP